MKVIANSDYVQGEKKKGGGEDDNDNNEEEEKKEDRKGGVPTTLGVDRILGLKDLHI